MPCDEILQEELYRVATLMVSEHTASSTTRAHQGFARCSSKWIRRNISEAGGGAGCFYHTKIIYCKQSGKSACDSIDNYPITVFKVGYAT
jgi:hypothetical protein